MIKKLIITSIAVLGVVGPAQAITVELDPSNQGIGSMNYLITGTIITITENWTGTGPGVLRFTDLPNSPSPQLWTVRKIINNNSGSDWNRLANELLDSGVDYNDPNPQPSFVPAGFSTSANGDGLSFAQGYNYARTSTVFGSVLADEMSDNRDYLDFYNGTLLNGASDNYMTFGLQAPFSDSDEPILLMQRPNAFSQQVPDAGATLGLMAVALLGLAGLRRVRA